MGLQNKENVLCEEAGFCGGKASAKPTTEVAEAAESATGSYVDETGEIIDDDLPF
jgi:hypothetical protein